MSIILSNVYKAQKGIIKISMEIEDNAIKTVRITGDFFMLPEEALPTLEGMLIGKRLVEKELDKTLDAFYTTGVETPLLTKSDFINAIIGAKNANQVA